MDGARNTCVCPPTTGRVTVTMRGNDNSLAAAADVTIEDLRLEIDGSGNRLVIEDGVRIDSLKIWFQGNGSTCVIGQHTYISSAHLVIAESGTRIEIGAKCMVASGVEIRTGDSHGIFDLTSRERINPGKDIRIGSRVWLANGVLVLKGAAIPDDSVVGARSVVTTHFSEPNAIYAGHPARLVRSNIAWGWHLDRFPEFLSDGA